MIAPQSNYPIISYDEPNLRIAERKIYFIQINSPIVPDRSIEKNLQEREKKSNLTNRVRLSIYAIRFIVDGIRRVKRRHRFPIFPEFRFFPWKGNDFTINRVNSSRVLNRLRSRLIKYRIRWVILLNRENSKRVSVH